VDQRRGDAGRLEKQHGTDPIFYSALVHACAEFTAVPDQLEITLRAMAWAARWPAVVC